MLSKHNSFALQIFIILSINVMPIITIKYGTQLNTIISDHEGKYDSAHVSITIDSIANEVEILMIRKRGSRSQKSAQRWLGIGFSADDSYINNHSNVYAIIANGVNYFGNVQEYTLSKKNSGSIYTIPEITVISDIHSEAGRNVTITRKRNGTFSFPLFPDQLDANNEYKIAVIAALGISTDYAHHGHGRGTYSRNLKILTFAPLLNDSSWANDTTTTAITTTTTNTIATTTASTTTTTRAASTTPELTANSTYGTEIPATTTATPDLTADSTNEELRMQIGGNYKEISTDSKMIIGIVILIFAVSMGILGIVWFTIGNNKRKNNDECDENQKQNNSNVK